MTGISFGTEESVLRLCETRSTLIARNIANSNTPNYKATDINFREALATASSTLKSSQVLQTTHTQHIQPHQSADGLKTYYRVPYQTSQDGNTVDDELERKQFIQNALRYQAVLGFTRNKASTLLKAFKGV